MLERPLPAGSLAFLLALAVSTLLTAALRRVSLARNWVKQPTEDRWHSQATPTLGGIAVFVAFAGVSHAMGLFSSKELLLLACGSTLVFFVGLVDDRFGLTPGWKLLGQVLAAFILIVGHRHLSLTGIIQLDYAVTLLWIVGITNAFNLLDNMNGLCAGVATIVAGFRGFLFLIEGEVGYAVLCLAFIGAVLGFLFFNFPAGRIFMGDSGSLFIGYWLAGVTLIGTYPHTRSYVGLLFFPLLVMLVPILDTALVTVTRSLAGRSIARGGKDHTSHRLVGYGFSETKAVLLLWCLSFASGAIALATSLLGIDRSIPLVGVLILGLAVFGTYLARLKISFLEQDQTRGRKARWLKLVGVTSNALFDLVLAVISYYTAYLLRFDLNIDDGNLQVFLLSAAELALIKLAVFLGLGVYRGWWGFFGLDDGLRLLRASLISSAVVMTYFFTLYRLAGMSRSVLFLDLFIFSSALLAFRLSFRLMDRWAPMPGSSQRRVLIWKADARGEFALRLIRQERKLKPVGFLSDSPEQLNYRIHGVPVLGDSEGLEKIARRNFVDGIVIASDGDAERISALHEECRLLGLSIFRAVLEIREEPVPCASPFIEEQKHSAVEEQAPALQRVSGVKSA